MQNRRRIIIVVSSAVAACALVLAGLFVFRDRLAPVSPVKPGQPGRPAAGVPLHRGAGQVTRPGAGREDRQHRERAAADRARPGRHRLCAAGRRRPEPVLRDLLLARPAGRRPGPERARRRPAAAPPVRPARVRLLGGAAPAAAGGGTGPHRRSLRRAGRRLLPGQPPGRPVQPVRPHQPAARRSPRREHRTGHRLPVRPAAGRRHGHRVPVGVLPGRLLHLPLVASRRAGGWSGWTARPR